MSAIHDERDAALGRLGAAPEDWRRWWQRHGERELRCILMSAWDPVGAGGAAEAWDEYDNYAPCVADRLRVTADPEEAARAVAEYLDHVEADFMGELTDERRRANGFLADTLVAWYEWSCLRGARPPQEWLDGN